ncbi:V-type ATP synthase subunit F [Candidatus Peribacteria bacterium]|nr:V-type ATP synthase subunit F [Candidatus Peribacteria bacterium]
MSHYSIAMVGSRETIAGFSLLGVDTYPVSSAKEAIDTLYVLRRKMSGEAHSIPRPVYGIIFITEDYAAGMTPEDEKKLAQGALPAIITIPCHHGATGFGLERLMRTVERAIGSNILA